MTDKEKGEIYVSKHPFRALFGAIRVLGLFVVCTACLYLSILSALEELWPKAIYYLMAMFIADNWIDKSIKERERVVNEIVSDK